MPIDCHRYPDPRAAERNPTLNRPFSNDPCQTKAKIGIIDTVVSVGTKIGDFVTVFNQPIAQRGLEFERGMVGGDGDTHGGLIGQPVDSLHPA